MRRSLPSLQALRAFEAAGRIGNFTKAAEELLLTQSAVSRHIRNLEADLGVKLFVRSGKQVMLTDDGIHLRGIVGHAFDSLADGIETLRARHERRSLTVSLLPSLAANWLVHWVGRYSAKHPDIDLNIHCSRALVDFDREGIDIAIRYGRGLWPGCAADLIMREEIAVVCAPSLRDQLRDNPTPEHLAQMPLLYSDDPDTWQVWLRAAGFQGLSLPKGPVFTDANALLQAAINAQGVMLGRSVLIANDLAAGHLVEPFDIRIPASYAYYLVTPTDRPDNARVRDFKAFVASIAEGTGLSAASATF